MIEFTMLDVEEKEVEIAGTKSKIWTALRERPFTINPSFVSAFSTFQDTDWTSIALGSMFFVLKEPYEVVAQGLNNSHPQRVLRHTVKHIEDHQCSDET